MMICAFIVIFSVLAGQSLAQCRQALALGLDVSGSVDSREYRSQIDGLAMALRHPEVRQALLSVPQAPINLAVFEWSDPSYQRVLLDWTSITDPAALDQAINQIESTRRNNAPPGTGLGAAIETGAGLLASQIDCWKRTLDISGDGKHNIGPNPRDVRAALPNAALTINALVIGADAPASTDNRQVEIAELSSYFRANVIFGPDAFVETALGFKDYEAAMVRKLKRELEGLVLSSLMPPAAPASVPPENVSLTASPKALAPERF